MIDKLCSVCCLKDIKTWVVASTQIIKFIKAKKYYLIVPDAEVELFRLITPSRFTIEAESKYCGIYNLEKIKKYLPNNMTNRAGWYLQQILKIEFIRIQSEDENILILDSDTIPLKELTFINEQGILEMYEGIHHPKIHEPYFETIKSILNIDREVDKSFISQNMIVKSKWIVSLCDSIQEYTGELNWISALVERINYKSSISAFSEYETIGTFIFKNYNDEWKFKDNSDYYRNGTALVGCPANINSEEWVDLSKYWDYITFENYENVFVRGLNIGSGNDRLEKTLDGNLFINVDLERYQGVDMIMDVSKIFPFPKSQFKYVTANNILERVDDVLTVISEIDRCLMVGGLLKIEVPFIGSYNHGTDITHKRGMTYNSFNFLFKDGRNYLYRDEKLRKFNYKLIKFERENIINGILVREYFEEIPRLGDYKDWIKNVNDFQIPGTFGFLFMKCE